MLLDWTPRRIVLVLYCVNIYLPIKARIASAEKLRLSCEPEKNTWNTHYDAKPGGKVAKNKWTGAKKVEPEQSYQTESLSHLVNPLAPTLRPKRPSGNFL
jgi:hypothetical protein